MASSRIFIIHSGVWGSNPITRNKRKINFRPKTIESITSTMQSHQYQRNRQLMFQLTSKFSLKAKNCVNSWLRLAKVVKKSKIIKMNYNWGFRKIVKYKTTQTLFVVQLKFDVDFSLPVTGNTRHTGSFCRNFFHSTIIPLWRMPWVSREANKFKEL